MDEGTAVSRTVRLVAVSGDVEHVNYAVTQTILTGSVRFDIGQRTAAVFLYYQRQLVLPCEKARYEKPFIGCLPSHGPA